MHRLIPDRLEDHSGIQATAIRAGTGGGSVGVMMSKVDDSRAAPHGRDQPAAPMLVVSDVMWQSMKLSPRWGSQ